MATTQRYTVDDLELLRETSNMDLELLDGELLMSPYASRDHQRFCQRIFRALDRYIGAIGFGEVGMPSVVQVWPDLEFHPDILVAPRPPWGLRWRDLHEWWLAVEVASPSTRAFDRGHKRSRYLELGVRELWLVDADIETVTVARRDTLDVAVTGPATLNWRAPNAQTTFSLDLGALFTKD